MTKNKKKAKSEHREYIYVPDIADHKTRFQEKKSGNCFSTEILVLVHYSNIELSWSPGNLDVYMQYIYNPNKEEATRRHLAWSMWMGLGGNPDDYHFGSLVDSVAVLQ